MQQQTIVLSKATLVKYTLVSLIFAAITLLTIILPAEYNIDPTGIGQTLGLTVFHDVKLDTTPLLESGELQEKTKPAIEVIETIETIEIIVPALSGVEYKFTMQQYKKLSYEWSTNGTALYFDLHGEPEGDTTGYFESYAIATLKGMEGSFTTPFSGVHGWYWKNTSNSPVTVQLTVKGEFGKHSLK
jgi:hypothetical protein